MRIRSHAGFSFIELLTVVAILGIIIAVAVPNLLSAVKRADDMAARAYIHHIVNGIEAARDRGTNTLPPLQSCATLVHVSADPKSVTSCRYAADLDHDSYTVTVSSVTGKTFQYDGSEIVQVE